MHTPHAAPTTGTEWDYTWLRPQKQGVPANSTTKSIYGPIPNTRAINIQAKPTRPKALNHIFLRVQSRLELLLKASELVATMKNLLACLAILAAFCVAAQTETSNFPYNPDSDGDGLIGVSDLVNLLGYYETQFNVSAQLNSDSTSAIHIPSGWWFSMGRTQCASLCDALPGPWHIMSESGFATHLETIRSAIAAYVSGTSSYQFEFFQLDHGALAYGTELPGQRLEYDANGINYQNESYPLTSLDLGHCLCELRQRPRVEYDFCEGSMANIQPCAAEKVSQGWYPLELTSAGGAVFVQTFWRWED